MTELRNLIKNIIPTEIQQDENVVNNSFVLDPYKMDEILMGDGVPQEISTTYQLDIFFKGKGECINKAQQILVLLQAYSCESFSFRWETNARLWRGTTTIEKL